MMRYCRFFLFIYILKSGARVECQEEKLDVPSFRRKCTALRTSDGWYNVYCIRCEFTGMPPQLPKLTRALDMSYNNIAEVKENSFSSSLYHLQSLNLSHNFIHMIDDSAFIGVIGNTIEILDLSSNQLRTLPKFFPNSLKVLKLDHNLFQSFHLFDIAYLYALKGLHLNNNQITTLETKPVIKICDVMEVFVKKTKSQTEKSFILPTLDFLDLSNNKLKKLSLSVLKSLPYLTYLLVKNNKLTSISNKTFIGNRFCVLKYIDFSYNNIRNVGKETFRKCLLLKYLSLAHNQLQKFPLGFGVLEWLDISFNQIKSIGIESKSSLYPQEVLLLGGNPFHCDCRLKWLKEFFDTREYMLMYLKVDHPNFVPACASPENLVGEFWDVLSSDMFYCLHGDSDHDVSLLDEKGESLSTKIRIDLVQVESAATVIRLMWDCGHMCNRITAFHVKYRLFGHKEFHVTLPFSAVSRTYTLRGLRPNTAYVICLSVYLVEGEAEDECLEVMTQPKNKFYFQTIFDTLSSSLAYLVILLISFGILYQLT